MYRKKNITSAAKAAGFADKAQDVWDLYKEGSSIEDAFVKACGFDVLHRAAVNKRVAVARAVAEEKVADKADKPDRAAKAVRAKLEANQAQDKSDKAKHETEKFLNLLSTLSAPQGQPGTVNKVVDEAKEDLEAIEEIAKVIGDDVAAYRADSIRLTGGEPDDDPNASAEAVNTALNSAKAAISEAKAAVSSGRSVDAESFANDVAGAREQAETARDELEEKRRSLKQQMLVDTAKKERKEGSVVQKWLKPRAVTLGLLGATAILVLVAAVVGLPSWLPTGAVLSVAFVAILAMTAWAIAQEPPAGRGSAAMATAVAVAVLVISINSGGGDGDNSDEPSEVETPVPIGVIVTGATFEADVPHPTEIPSD